MKTNNAHNNTSKNQTQKMKILFIIWTLSLGGGAEKILAYLIRGLACTDKYDIDLQEVVHFDTSWEVLPEDVTVLPPVLDCTNTSFFARIRRIPANVILSYFPRLSRNLYRRTFGYDLVVSFNYQIPSFLALPEEKSITWVHSSVEDLANSSLKRRNQSRVFETNDAIVSIAKRTRKSIEDLFPEQREKIRTIYNGFPTESIVSMSNDKTSYDISGSSILFIGALDKRKSPVDALKAFKSILIECPSAEMYFLGAGNLSKEIVRMAKELSIEEKVHLLGYVKNPYPYIKAASCILSTSKSEGFQSIFVEGLILGTPFISTPVGAAEELADDGMFGKIIESSSQAGEAYCDLMRHQEDPDYKESMNAFASKFTIEHQVECFEKLLYEIIDSPISDNPSK